MVEAIANSRNYYERIFEALALMYGRNLNKIIVLADHACLSALALLSPHYLKVS